jgi:hypothetical protein
LGLYTCLSVLRIYATLSLNQQVFSILLLPQLRKKLTPPWIILLYLLQLHFTLDIIPHLRIHLNRRRFSIMWRRLYLQIRSPLRIPLIEAYTAHHIIIHLSETFSDSQISSVLFDILLLRTYAV